jgi:hypothetical protein
MNKAYKLYPVYLQARKVPRFDLPRAKPGEKHPDSINQKNISEMVTIIGTEKRQTKSGKDFLVMILQGDIEIAVSKETGKPYLTARKTSIPCTFDETVAKTLIGHQLPGGIERVEVKPYEFVVPSTGKKIKLSHLYQYSKEPTTVMEVIG